MQHTKTHQPTNEALELKVRYAYNRCFYGHKPIKCRVKKGFYMLYNQYQIVHSDGDFPYSLLQMGDDGWVICTHMPTNESMDEYVSNLIRIFNNRFHRRLSVDMIGECLYATDMDTQETLIVNTEAGHLWK